jgi:3',5'-cyclic AMP phosphodiesterase CpdA
VTESRPFLLAQLTDPHIGATWGPADPIAGLEAVVQAVGQLETPVDAVVISGDLVDNGLDSEYERLAQIVGRVGVPVHVLPGNHDDRDRLRDHFAVEGRPGSPVQYSVDLGPMRLVALDTTRPGHDGGEVDRDRLAWLDQTLAGATSTPTLIAMHHPPFRTTLPAFDPIGLPEADQRALQQVVARHGQVRALVAGHIHRTSAATVAGRPALTVLSTYVHSLLRFRSPEVRFAAQPRGFAVHALLDGELVSHIEHVGSQA